MSRSPWRDALDGQIKILRELRKPAAAIHLGKSGRIPDIEAAFSGNKKQLGEFLAQFGVTTADGLAELIREAEPIHIEHDIRELLMRQLQQFVTDRNAGLISPLWQEIASVKLSPAMLPVERGLIWFGSPDGIIVDDVVDDADQEIGSVAIRAIYFGDDMETVVRPSSLGSQLRFNIESHAPTPEQRNSLGCVLFLDARNSGFRNMVREFGDHLVPVPIFAWQYGTTINETVRGSDKVSRAMGVDEHGTAVLTANAYAYLMLLFRLMLQRITRWGGVGLLRTEQREAEREKLRPRVQLVTWRKANYKYPEGHIPVPKNWSCRWSVREHYRRYRSGKVVKIQSYVKGPEGRPFRLPVQRANDVRQ